MWTVYYPALALERVPSVLPHTNGAILSDALSTSSRRACFSRTSPSCMSDSDKVRKYSSVRVAGREIEHQYRVRLCAESYIDFGIPLMFVPVFGFGVFLGAMYALFRSIIWHRELFVAFGTVAFWLSAYLFERSWATMLGVTVGFMVYLGAPSCFSTASCWSVRERPARAAGTEIMFETPSDRYQCVSRRVAGKLSTPPIPTSSSRPPSVIGLNVPCRCARAEIGRVLTPEGRSHIQMAQRFGVLNVVQQARRRFRRPHLFQVRYWPLAALRSVFSEAVGPTKLSVDGFFSINAQSADLDLLRFSHRALVHASGFLRRLASRLPWLILGADSVYVNSRSSKS